MIHNVLIWFFIHMISLYWLNHFLKFKDDKKKSEAIRTNGIVEAQETDEKSNDKFPCSIIFIIGNEFCERFCYYGLRGESEVTYRIYTIESIP